MNSQAEESNPNAKTHALVYDHIEPLKIPSLTALRTIAAHLIPASRNNGGPHLSNETWRPPYVNRFSIRSRPGNFARHQAILRVAITIQSFEHNL
jgi:hypothetical protein